MRGAPPRSVTSYPGVLRPFPECYGLPGVLYYTGWYPKRKRESTSKPGTLYKNGGKSRYRNFCWDWTQNEFQVMLTRTRWANQKLGSNVKIDVTSRCLGITITHRDISSTVYIFFKCTKTQFPCFLSLAFFEDIYIIPLGEKFELDNVSKFFRFLISILLVKS